MTLGQAGQQGRGSVGTELGVVQGCGPVRRRAGLAGGLVAGTRVIPTGHSAGLEPPRGEEGIFGG